jgi:hypothetical protein
MTRFSSRSRTAMQFWAMVSIVVLFMIYVPDLPAAVFVYATTCEVKTARPANRRQWNGVSIDYRRRKH